MKNNLKRINKGFLLKAFIVALFIGTVLKVSSQKNFDLSFEFEGKMKICRKNKKNDII